MRYIDVIMVSDFRCARALRRCMRKNGETGLVVFRRKGELHVAMDDSCFIAVDFDSIVHFDDHAEINLFEQNVAWPGDMLNWKKLPEGYVVWSDGDRYKKVGGVWCRLSSKNYICVSETDANECLPKAWFR